MRRYRRDYDDWFWYGGGMAGGDSVVIYEYGTKGSDRGNYGGRRQPRGESPGLWRPRPRIRVNPYDVHFGPVARRPRDRPRGYGLATSRPTPSVPPASRSRWAARLEGPLMREIRDEVDDLVMDYLHEERYGADYARTVGLRTHGRGDRLRGAIRRAFGRPYDRTW